jgi:hypothetical protein
MARGGRSSENAGQKSREHPAIFQKLSSANPAGILDVLAKQALPLNEQGGFVLRRMLREMLRLILRPVLRIVDLRVASFGDNNVAHSRCARVNRPIFRQTSSLSTARGGERRRKCCATVAQQKRLGFKVKIQALAVRLRHAGNGASQAVEFPFFPI